MQKHLQSPLMFSSPALWLLSQLPAQAEGTDFSQGSFSKESYYVTLGLFVLSVPGQTPVNFGPQAAFQSCTAAIMESVNAV